VDAPDPATLLIGRGNIVARTPGRGRQIFRAAGRGY